MNMDWDLYDNHMTDSDGLKQGLWRTWYDNGQLHGEGYYVDGLRYGPWRYWLDNGELMWAVYYVNGIQEGEEIHYGY